MRVGIAVNPASGRGRGTYFGEQARRNISEYPVEVVDLSASSATECTARARQAALTGEIDALIAVGGDGMVHVGVCATAETGVPLGIVAVGSGNDNAREFRLPIRDVAASVHQVMGSLFGGRGRATDVMQISGEFGSTYALAILSAGIDADVNLRTNTLTWPKGNMRYLRALAQSIREYQPYGMRVSVDGRVCEGPATIVSVANCRYFGGGMNVAPRAETNDGLLDVVVGVAPNLTQLVPVVPLLFLGRTDSHPLVHNLRGKTIRLEDAPRFGGHAPIAMADGEVIGRLPLTITCLPGAIELLI